MIQASQAIQYIEQGLKQLISSQQIFGKLAHSQTSISLYLNTKSPMTPPQKTLRASNHHPSMVNMVKGGKKPWNTTNICVEFYEPIIGKNGKIKRNKFKTTVLQNSKGNIQPFSVDVYEYEAKLLDIADIPTIYNAIVSFINNGTYMDPLTSTNKAAKVISRTAKIVNRKPSNNTETSQLSTSATISKSNSKNLNCNTIKLKESDLRCIISEAIKRIIKDNKPVMTESYEPIGGGYEFIDENGIERISVVTIQSQSGQMCHIAEDDHCYLLFNDYGSGKNCTHIKWIFPEALKALQMLPLP